MTTEEELEQETRLRENLVRFGEIRLGRGLDTLADWQHETLRQDRERGRLVAKLNKIQGILVEHWDCPSHIGCDGLLEIQAVIDGDDD
jgi:hypothetical protein